MCSGFFYHIILTTLACCLINVVAITNTNDNDEVFRLILEIVFGQAQNLNRLEDDGQNKGSLSKYKDSSVRETLEKRTFAKPGADRRDTFYPPGHGFSVGTSMNVGATDHGYFDERLFHTSGNFHTNGNGYSYGTPSLHYPPVIYTHSFPSSNGPGGSGYGPSFGSGGGFGHGFGGGDHGGGFGGGGPSGGGPPGGGGVAGGQTGGGHPHPLALKGLIIPIAGVALLGAAAALAKTHPVLLQLGVVSGKRKRSIGLANYYPENPYVRPDINQIVL